jgi:hypothetical protein
MAIVPVAEGCTGKDRSGCQGERQTDADHDGAGDGEQQREAVAAA